MDSLTLTSIEGYSADLKCYLIVGTENGQASWSWSFNGKNVTDGDKYKIDNTQNTSSTLTIKNLKLEDKGSYTCYVWNNYGSHSRNTDLKVKSKKFEK